jgi:Ice-binding-like/PEP-CTERM motif
MNAMKLATPLLVALACAPGLGLAAPSLGSDLQSFAVLGASTVTNVPTSTIVGNVGVWSSGGANAITGFSSSPGVAVSDPQVTGGSVHAGTALAQSAQGQLALAITNLGLLGAGTTESANLAGLTLAPGIYTVPAGTTNLDGVLTLDGGGNANATWVFQMPSTLITSPGSVVNVINTGAGAGLYWDVGTSATLDTTTSFEGNILAHTSITLNDGATIGCGRALANVGAVTMIANTISTGCVGTNFEGSNGLSGGVNTAPVPEPDTFVLLGFGLASIVALRKRLFAGA